MNTRQDIPEEIEEKSIEFLKQGSMLYRSEND